jgi:hypothetical protein
MTEIELLEKEIKTKIRKAVLEAEKFPHSIIEYNFDILPDDDNHIKANSFYGYKAEFNKNVGKNKTNIIYKY